MTQLITDEQRAQLLSNGRQSIENPDFDPQPVVKLFTPDAPATWLLCDLGQGFPELGWVSLAELEALRRPLGLPIERDLYFRARKSIGAYAREARLAGRIAV